jgi:ribosomal-protein-alanine N-acetyltransferase
VLVFKKYPILETRRLLLRRIEPLDARAIYRLAQDAEITRYVAWEPHKTLRDTKEYIRLFNEEYQKGVCFDFVIAAKKRDEVLGLIGCVDIDETNKSLEIGYWLGREFWNNGYMTEALTALIDFCFRDLDMERLSAKHFEENAASGRVMQKAGMTFEGPLRKAEFVKGRYWNIKVYSILREDWRPAAEPPVFASYSQQT